jgi:hypothetical protein
MDMGLAGVDIGFSRKKPPGVLSFEGKKVDLMPFPKMPVKQCGVMGYPAAKRMCWTNEADFHFRICQLKRAVRFTRMGAPKSS